ncbi:MAG: Holliday junction resolvase RuvX [Flavobacteriales bacterium]|nr:MAG: Holliday junction resolvase RuvX [Flavobacteriales bacterium]
MGRVLALDYGKRRTGIAITDELQLIASGLTTVDNDDLMKFLKAYMNSENVSGIVVGEPKQMNSLPSESEAFIQPFIKRLAKQFPQIPIYRQDERFTSKMAVQSLLQAGVKKKQRRNKALVDEVSATLILQAYLNRIQ